METINRPQRIVHIITCLASSGASTMLYNLLTHMDRSLFEPIVISLDHEQNTFMAERLAEANIPIHYLNMKRSLGSSWHILRLAKLIKELNPAIIQGWMYHGNLATTLANRLLGDRYPSLWNVLRGIKDLDKASFTTRHMVQGCAKLSKKPNYILYNAYRSAQQHETIGYATERTQVIANGFDTQWFYNNPNSRKAIRSALNIPSDALVIGMIAYHQPNKQHTLFLEAAHLFNLHYPDVHFILVGHDVAVTNAQLTQKITNYQLTERVHLLGERQDIPAILNALDMFSLTSDNEAFSQVIGEAMACGVPCISNDVGDIARLIGNTGNVIPDMTASKLAFAWLEWMEAGSVWRQELGRQARQRIQQHYPIHKIAAQYQDIYKELVNHVRNNGILFQESPPNDAQHVGKSAQNDQHFDPQGA